MDKQVFLTFRFSLLIILTLLINKTVYSQYPKWMPNELKNKKFCGKLKTKGKLYGSTSYIEIPYEVLISETGVQIRMNPGDKFDRNEWGETIKVKYDYGTITEDEEEFCKRIKLSLNSNNESTDSPVFPKYEVTSIQFNLCTYNPAIPLTIDQKRRFANYKNGLPLPSDLTFCIKIPHYDSECGMARDNYVGSNVCDYIKTAKEIQEEEKERLKIENQKKGQDKFTALKIDSLLTLNSIENAALSYDQLNFPNLELKNKIQQLLEAKHEKDTIILDEKTTLTYISYHTKTKESQLLNLGEGVLEIKFNVFGNPTNAIIPNIGTAESNVNIPSIKVGSFEIKQNSKMTLNVTRRDSILISSIYNSGCSKTLYIDKYDNFYLKTKTGLPSAKIQNNAAVTVDKKTVLISKAFKKEKYINNVVVASNVYYTSLKVKILKKEK